MRRLAFIAVSTTLFAVTWWSMWPRDAYGHEIGTTTVRFDREIVSILNRRCVMCHSEESNLSFSLQTYEETWLRGRSIRAQTLARHMPPWSAVRGYGEFINDNGLTLREMQFIVSWVEGRAPRDAGTVFLNVTDPDAVAPEPVRARGHFDDWRLGEPSLSRRLVANLIEAGQSNVTRRVVVDLGLAADTWIRGLEYLPSDRRVVRAASFTVEGTGQWLGSWTPWFGLVDLPRGVAYRIPAGSRIVAEIHYAGADDRVIEQGTLGLFFADQPSSQPVSDLVLESTKGETLSSGVGRRFRAVAQLTTDSYLLSLWPEIRLGMRSIEVSARRPDGRTDILLLARNPSPEWPTPYIFRRPVALPKGTKLHVAAYYADEATASPLDDIRLTISRYEGKAEVSKHFRR